MNDMVTATRQASKGNAGGRNQANTSRRRQELPETTEELQMLLQVEGDRRVSQALKKAWEKWQSGLSMKLKAERREAERLARLSMEQCEKQVLEKYRKEIEEKERALKQKELEIKAIYLLLERKLPVEFKDFIISQDEKNTLKRVDDFGRLWSEKLDEAVTYALSCICWARGESV